MWPEELVTAVRTRRGSGSPVCGVAPAGSGFPLGYLDTALPFRCIIRTDRVPYLPIIYNNTFQIFQSPDYVVISVEMIHSARVIPVDGRPHLGKTLRQWLGDSRGRWDGNTLVVETSSFQTRRWRDLWVCGSRNVPSRRALYARPPTRSATRSRSRIPGPGRDRGRR